MHLVGTKGLKIGNKGLKRTNISRKRWKADEIPLLARLFALIDVYDARISDRPYPSAWPADKIRAYLQEQFGTHFDPRTVNALLTLLEQRSPTD